MTTTPPAAPARALRRGAWAAAFAVALALPVLAALPPFVGPALRGVLMALLDPLCHQLPARSFHVGGVQLALCHRCFGVALGLPLGTLLGPSLGRRPATDGRLGLVVLVIAATPMALDWALEVTGLWTNTPATRLATGLVFGLVAGAAIGRAFARTARTP